MIDICIIYLIIATASISKTYSAPFDTTAYDDYTTGEETTVTTTTTTTTIAPEDDREWEDLVLGGPSVVNHLGLFMVLASRKDPVMPLPAGYQIKHIHDAKSLRAILKQVSSAMQTAFRMARDDLDRAQNSMTQIPEHLKAGLLLIQTAPKELLGKLLPYTLKNVDRAAAEGSIVSKPTLDRFVSVGLLLEELSTLLAAITVPPADAENIPEARAYANDLKSHWELLISLFRKFSERADITRRIINEGFIEPTNEALKLDGFKTTNDRSTHLSKLIPAAVAIDQSSYLLDMMIRTYTDVSNDYIIDQIEKNHGLLTLSVELERAKSQRQLWQNIVSESVKVARLAQTRHNQFSSTGVNRQDEYSAYSKGVLAA